MENGETSQPVSRVACANHSNLPAIFACGRCGAAICDLCAFPQGNGSRLCPSCVTRQAPAAPQLRGGLGSSAMAAQNQKCKQHPNVAAAYVCHKCSTPVCKTCDFYFPGNIHLCPECATSTKPTLSSGRKIQLIISYVLAGWATLVFMAMLSGLFYGLASNQAERQVLGMLLMIIVLGPAVTGVGLGIGAKGRGSGSLGVWLAVIWNSLILGGFMLRIVIGMMMKG